MKTNMWNITEWQDKVVKLVFVFGIIIAADLAYFIWNFNIWMALFNFLGIGIVYIIYRSHVKWSSEQNGRLQKSIENSS